MKRFAYLDIEASHTNWHDAEIIEIAFVIKDEKGKELDFFQSLVKPQRKITEEIIDLTGINEKMLENAPEFNSIAQKVFEKLEDSIIVAHKIEFDYEVLNKHLQSVGLELNQKKICTLQMSQRLIPELKSYSLKSLCEMLQIKLQKNHRALDDAQALFQLHHYLRLINGELNEENKFLPDHKKLIEKSAQRPGVIIFSSHTTKEIFKSENIHKKLEELLTICPRNKHRLHMNIKTTYTASLIEAGLVKIKLEKPIYPYCIYSVKSNQGKLILRIGKTNLKKKALYFTRTKNEAKKILTKLLSSTQNKKFIYQDSKDNPSDIVRENIQLNKEIKKLVAIEKNYLIRSHDQIDGKYQYTLIRGNHSYASFKSSEELKKSEDIIYKGLSFKNIGPREYMSLNHSLKWIKNQKNKTDLLFEIKSTKRHS